MNSSGEKSIMTNPISQLLDKNNYSLEKDFPDIV